MKTYRYLHENKIEEIKKVVKITPKKEIARHKNPDFRELFENYDYIVEIENYNTIIENSELKKELDKIESLKMVFTQLNNEMLNEKTFAEVDELEETNDREILNRALVNNIRRRGLSVSHEDSIYFKNRIDESYNEVKSYMINIALSWQYNRNFEEIARRLKNAIASTKQSYTQYQAILTIGDRKRRYAIVLNELRYNNERFSKEIFKMFIPFTSLALAEVVQATIEESDSWKESGYHVVENRSEKIMSLQNMR